MTKVIFRSGMTTIGGTIIEVINNNDRIIFDFGCVFDPSSNNEEIPNVEGIYKNDSEYNDAILISHNHLDHIKALNLIDKEIDVFMHESSIKLLNSLNSISFNQIMGSHRSYNEITLNSETKINSFSVTAIEVDHDVIGAVCFLIKTDDLTMLYTGDLRMHGINNHLTKEMLSSIVNEQIDILIIEGVMISFIEDDTKIISSDFVDEENYSINFTKKIRQDINEDSLILFNPYIMNLEMMNSFISLAKELNKKIVFRADYAKIYNDFFPNKEIFVLEEDTYNTNLKVIKMNEITNNCILQFNFKEKNQYMKVINGATLFQSGGEPLGDFDPNYQELINFCKTNNVKLVAKNVGGHAYPNNLKYIVDFINPKILCPIHSFKPYLLKPKDGIQILPEMDEELVFVNHQLKEKF
ncbi:MAG: MBL fold metallo-hydrolase [Mycoplasmatales bacterium]